MSAKKYPRSQAIHDAEMKDEPAYVSWDGKMGDDVNAVAKFTEAFGDFRGIKRSTGRWNQDLSSLDTNVSGRPGLSQEDYYAFRPEERPPHKHKDIINAADGIYQSVGLIRNIVDLMADFACQGIRLVHPQKGREKFYQDWFKKVRGQNRSERFLNNLYRTGAVIVRKQTAKLKSGVHLTKVLGKPDISIEKQQIFKREIPLKYIFLNPSLVDVVGGALASFVGTPQYAISLPRHLVRIIQSPKTASEKALVSKLPDEIKWAAKNNKPAPLPPEKTSVFHYKKDDWQSWAFPMIYAIMDDITVLNKMRLADMAALDGATSNLRIFKIGNLEHKIAPTRVAASKLSDILENNVGGGTMDLVWGPDIELLESDTAVHQFLGEAKYVPHLNAIYAGLGIPPTLTGTGGSSGTTNNLISLKTLVSRLEYGRSVLISFWQNEIVEIQKAMGFRQPAKVEFTTTDLGDEAAEKALLIQLADRNLISDELIQHLFNNDPEMERVRLNREHRERDKGVLLPKSGPWHDPQIGTALKKLALQSGVSTPGQVGLREDAPNDMKTYPKQKGEKPALEMRQPAGQTPAKKGQPQQGRPKNSKDKQKRKQKRFVPKTKATLEIWAQDAQVSIAKILNPWVLDLYKKKNMRSLTQAETNNSEKLKFGVLCNLDPLVKINKEVVLQALGSDMPSCLYDLYRDNITNVSSEIDRKLTLDELKYIQANIYVEYILDEVALA